MDGRGTSDAERTRAHEGRLRDAAVGVGNLLLHAAERVAILAHDEADAILGDIHDSQVVPLLLLEVDVNRTDALLRHELYVVTGLVVERTEGSGRREAHEVDGTGA